MFYLKEMKRQGNNSGSEEPQTKVVRLPQRPLNCAIAAVSRNELSSNGAIAAVSRNEPNSTVVKLPSRPSNGADAIAVVSQNEPNSTVVRVVKLPPRILNAACAISAVSQNDKSSTSAGAIAMISQNKPNSTVVKLPSRPSNGADEIAANIKLPNTSFAVSTTLSPRSDIRLSIPPSISFVKPTSRVCGGGARAGGLHVLIPSSPPPLLSNHEGCHSLQRRSQSPQMPASGGRVTSISPIPIPLKGRSSTPTPPGRTLQEGLDISLAFTHVLELFKSMFPKYFQSLKTQTKTKMFIEALTAMLLSASLNEGNPMRFHTHPVLVYCMFMRLAEMYLTLRQESTPLENILQLIDTAFTRVISGDQLSVWDRMMTIVTELKVQSDNLLAVSKFICDPSKARIIKGHMTALSSLCEQCRMKDRLQNLRTSLHSKVNKINPQHGIPFWTITSALTCGGFYHYFQSLGLENLAHEYYEVFVACFRVDSSTTPP